MTYKLVDVKDNSMWLLDEEIVIVNRATPDTVYFNDWLDSGKESAPLGFFLANAEFIEEDKTEYYKKIRVGDSWWCKYGRVDIEEFNGEYACFYDDKGRYGEVHVERFLEEFVPYKDGMENAIKGSLVIPHSGKKVGELLNDDVVVVIIATDGAYKGGHTTKVRYELADFMDDEPPFMEVLFVDKYDDVVYFTEDMNQPVYEMNGMYVVEVGNK